MLLLYDMCVKENDTGYPPLLLLPTTSSVFRSFYVRNQFVPLGLLVLVDTLNTPVRQSSPTGGSVHDACAIGGSGVGGVGVEVVTD